MGWTADERLVLLNEEGTYRLYNLSGSYTQYTLGTDEPVISSRIHVDGLVALTASPRSTITLLEVRGWSGGSKPVRMAEPGLEEPPVSWSVIPPDASISGHTQVLLSPADGPSASSILTIDSLEVVDQRVSRGPFSHIAVSPNGKYLGLLTLTGMLWVVSSDFGTSLAEFDVSALDDNASVNQIEWVGNDAVALTTSAGLCTLVGPMGDTLPISSSPSPPVLISEPDGLRILSTQTHTLLQKVPPSSLAVFTPGSTHPSATLLDAYDLFMNSKGGGGGGKGVGEKATRCEEALRRIREGADMARAVDGVVDAAGREWEVYWQRRLLEVGVDRKGLKDASVHTFSGSEIWTSIH